MSDKGGDRDEEGTPVADVDGTEPSKKGPLRFAPLVIIALVAVIGLLGPGIPESGPPDLGFRSLLPALTTLVLVFFTREVVSSLFAGILVAGFIIQDLNIIDRFLIPSVGSEDFAVILLVYLWALGGLIGLWTRTGGARYFATWAGERMVRGPKSAKLFAWLMGIVFHQGGTISTVLAGTTVKPVTDAEKVAHEEVSYIVDSTASPIATVIPFNAWPLYVAGLVVGTIPILPDQQSAVSFFFRSIPFNFYGIFAVIMTLLFALELLPWEGRRMRRARERARSTGQLDRPDSSPLVAKELEDVNVPDYYKTGMIDFLAPLGTLILVAAFGVVLAVFEGIGAGSVEVFLSNISVPIAEAFGLGVMAAIVVALLKGMSAKEVVEGVVHGCKGVTIGALVLALAVTLGTVSGELGTAAFIVEATSDLISPVLLPPLVMLICMGVAFSIGSSWGTYAVVFPLAMPLAYAISQDPTYLSIVFGAVLGGAVFGDQCSPISDTTILSSLATGSDVMDHVLTQLPLALVAAGAGAVLSALLAFLVI